MTDLSTLSAKETMARTLWAEARGEGYLGMLAVACSIMNRVNTDLGNDGKPDWWGEGIKAVCLKPFQFSCWNSNDPNRPKLLAVTTLDPDYSAAMAIASLTADGYTQDVTRGATHYFDIRMPHEKIPDWADKSKPTCKIGHHAFFKDVP